MPLQPDPMPRAPESGVDRSGQGQVAAAVEVAVDAPGASQPYDYSVPDRLAPIEPGEAVLVEFGRNRQALGVVLGLSPKAPAVELKPILARVHSDGALVPRLTLDFARWISSEYLAPPATTLRSMLPPGMLEKLELVAELLPGVSGTAEGEGSDGPPGSGASPGSGSGSGVLPMPDPFEEAIRQKLAAGPRRARDLEVGGGGPACCGGCEPWRREANSSWSGR